MFERLLGRRGEKRGLRLLGLSAGLAIGIGLVVILVAVQITSRPQFCGTCHIMKPYYKSWTVSTHKQVACVECHIPPGAMAEVHKKYEALSMVAKYLTKTYGTRVWAEVDDAACLRCHERRLLDGKEDFGGVVFDHTPHLTESRRGLKLRCTSCHSQIVQGSHIAVTVSTCVTCHFHREEVNKGLSSCTTCHTTPQKVLTVGKTQFDHAQVDRKGMDCALCHAGAVIGDGSVPPQNCVSCHSEPERLKMYDKTEFIHRKHVSEHKVDCSRCHLMIEHGRDIRRRTPAATECAKCHSGPNSPQAELYAGIGGRGIPDMPSEMYTVGVTCTACHSTALRGITPAAAFADGARHTHAAPASAVSCMMCHGSEYGTIFESWKVGMEARTQALGRQMTATAVALGSRTSDAWSDAQTNYYLVRNGNGLHNVTYAYAALDKAREQMNEARRSAGLAALPSPWLEIRGGAECLACHRGVETQRGSFNGKAFAHAPHVGAARLACDACHRTHTERAPGEVVRFGANGCTSCHHAPSSAPVTAAACDKCHGDIRTKVFTSFRGPFVHGPHLEAGAECATCHSLQRGDPRPAKAACMTCHEEG